MPSLVDRIAADVSRLHTVKALDVYLDMERSMHPLRTYRPDTTGMRVRVAGYSAMPCPLQATWAMPTGRRALVWCSGAPRGYSTALL